jgi:signal transduction histidine kinase
MILLVTPSERATECAAALNSATGEEVVVAESLVRATMLLRAGCFRMAVLDQYLLETNGDEQAPMLSQLGTALLLQVNFAITGMDRLVREVRSALERREREETTARLSVVGDLQSELNNTLTALLLSVEMALQTPNLPDSAREKLRTMQELLRSLCHQLEIPSHQSQSQPALC